MQQQQRRQRTKTETILLYGYYVATWIVGFAAIAGFWMSINSSREVSRALEKITDGVTYITIPLIKFDNYNWTPNENSMSCENPPVGIFFTYINASNVPIQIYHEKTRYFYGDNSMIKFFVLDGLSS